MGSIDNIKYGETPCHPKNQLHQQLTQEFHQHLLNQQYHLLLEIQLHQHRLLKRELLPLQQSAALYKKYK
jgi:hypothetical protein